MNDKLRETVQNFLNDHVSVEVIEQLENIAIELYQNIKEIKE
jgi:hypothetical protein